MRRSIFNYLSLLVISVFIFSCSKDDGLIGLKPDNQGTNDYFVSEDGITSLQVSNLKTLYSQAAFLYPGAADLKAYLKSDVQVSKMIYKTKLGDQDIQASALLCFPKKVGTYPVVCFQNGTNVLHDEAPTEDSGSQNFLLLESIASMGFVVVIPDYPGFGKSEDMPHPYLIKDLTMQALKDALNATAEYSIQPTAGFAINKNLYLVGYSQGGWATLELQKEIESDNLLPYHLIASSCGAGPYDINSVCEKVLSEATYPEPYFLAYLVNAYSEYGEFGSEFALSDVFNEPYASVIPGLFDGEHSSSDINSELSTDLETLLTADFRSGFSSADEFEPIRTAFEANSVQAWAVSTPTLLTHGTADETVPFQVTLDMFDELDALSTADDIVQINSVPNEGHTGTIIPFGFRTIEWFLEFEYPE